MSNLHYSLFRCLSQSGNLVIFDLSQICHVEIDQGMAKDLYRVHTSCWGEVALNPQEGDLLLEAWNLYKNAYHASFLVDLDKEPGAAIKAGFRQDAFLMTEAIERQRFMEENQ